jgi:hypothetical protein
MSKPVILTEKSDFSTTVSTIPAERKRKNDNNMIIIAPRGAIGMLKTSVICVSPLANT